MIFNPLCFTRWCCDYLVKNGTEVKMRKFWVEAAPVVCDHAAPYSDSPRNGTGCGAGETPALLATSSCSLSPTATQSCLDTLFSPHLSSVTLDLFLPQTFHFCYQLGLLFPKLSPLPGPVCPYSRNVFECFHQSSMWIPLFQEQWPPKIARAAPTSGSQSPYYDPTLSV